MFVLVMNPMQGRTEACEIVARAETREALQRLLDSERVKGGYSDGGWGKVFRKDGPLEWFNDPTGGEVFGQGIFDVGTADEAAAKARADWESRFMHVRLVD